MIEPNLTKFLMLILAVVCSAGIIVGFVDAKRREWINSGLAGIVALTVISALAYGF